MCNALFCVVYVLPVFIILNLIVQRCIVHICGRTIAGSYKRTEVAQNNCSEDMWDIRVVLVPVKCFQITRVHHFRVFIILQKKSFHGFIVFTLVITH